VKINNKICSFSLTLFSLSMVACGNGDKGTTVNPTSSTPDLIFTSFAAPATANAGNDDQINITYTLANIGDAVASDFAGISISFYLSKDSTITVDDIQFDDYTIVDGISADDEHTHTYSARLPNNISSGTYYIGAIADPDEYRLDYLSDVVADYFHIEETNESNNVSTTSQITVTGAGTCTDDIYESNDVLADATLLEYGASNAQNHNMCLDGSDWFKFSAVQGGMYIIETTSLGSNADPYLGLYDTDSVTLLDQDDYSGGSDTDNDHINDIDFDAAKIEFTAPSNGTYYIQVGYGERVNLGELDNTTTPGLNTEYTISIL